MNLTDVQKAWLNILVESDKRDTDMKGRSEATRGRVFARSRRGG